MLSKCIFVLLSIKLILSAREPENVTIANQGTISGMYITRNRINKIIAYVGIPYALPPLDFRRFLPPEFTDPPVWDGVRNGSVYAADCMQIEPQQVEVNSANPVPRHDELFMQLLEGQMEKPRKREYSEDCLYLNVYVPDGGGELKSNSYPVIVWFHGGNFIRGSPNDVNPFQLVWRQKVIFVSVAYRLNIFGFFTSLDNEAPGNYGMMDQVAALTWVKNNIASFGGDSSNICIFGHDAGAVSVGLHLASAYSAGLFDKAISMSGNVLAPDTVKTPRKEAITVDKIAYSFQCFRKPTIQLMDCLRRQDAEALLTIGEPLAEWKPIVDFGFSNHTLPFLPDLPSKLYREEGFRAVPVLAGYTNMEDAFLLKKNDTKDEGINNQEFDMMRKEIVLSDIIEQNSSCFENQHIIQDTVEFYYRPQTDNQTILRKLFLELYSEKVHGATNYQFAKYLSKQAPVYLYRFDLKPFSDIANEGIPGWIGVPHNFDLIYIFGLPYLALPKDLSKWDDRDKTTSDHIMKMWTDFARYSHPTNSVVIFDWKPFREEEPGYFIIERQKFSMSTPENINYKAFDFWSDFYPRILEIGTKCCKTTARDDDDSGTHSIRTKSLLYILIAPFIMGLFIS